MIRVGGCDVLFYSIIDVKETKSNLFWIAH